jgi:Flp pilus assembly protein TadG
MGSVGAVGSRRFRRPSSRGQALVEFALLGPLLFLLVFAGLDFTRAYLVRNAITNSAREGARYAALHPTGTAAIRARVKTELNSVVANPADSDIHVAWVAASPPAAGCPGSETEDLNLYRQNLGCFPYVRIKVYYPFTPMTPTASRFVGTGLVISNSVTMAVE